jgi:hypothetical protein
MNRNGAPLPVTDSAPVKSPTSLSQGEKICQLHNISDAAIRGLQSAVDPPRGPVRARSHSSCLSRIPRMPRNWNRRQARSLA